MFKQTKRVKGILDIAVKLYDDDYYSKTNKHLSKGRLKEIRKEIKDIADKKSNGLIKLTKFLKPLVLPTAKRITLETRFDLQKLKNGKSFVIYMPNHKSHLDEFMIGYTLVANKIPLPIIAAGENLFKSRVTGYLMKSYGAFKIRRDKYSGDEHYYRMLSSYLGACMINGDQLMSFQEGTRPRDGKIAIFRKGLIGTVESLFNRIKNEWDTELEDITFVPVAINWSENPDEIKLTEDGLYLEARIFKDIDLEVYTAVKTGALSAFSIGIYINAESYSDLLDAYVVDSGELVEVSLVTVPSNAKSVIENVDLCSMGACTVLRSRKEPTTDIDKQIIKRMVKELLK